ncbi:MAG: aldolase/citrate lyase family protein [Litorilinea sp.]
MYPNPLKQKIKNGELILGTSLPALADHVATLTSKTDIDFLWIDTEHWPYGTESLGAIPVLIRRQGVAPLIRVAWNDPALIKKAIDAGAVAVMVPQVDTPEEAAQAVKNTYYPPLGERGVSPTWPLIAGEDWATVIRTANDETVLMVQIESVEACDNLEAIAQVPGIDVLMVGPTDLAASMGFLMQNHAPEVQAVMREIPKRLQGSGIAIATTLESIDEIQEKLDWGYTVMNVGSPLGYGLKTLSTHLETLRSRSQTG